MKIKAIAIASGLCLMSSALFAQDLMSMLDSVQGSTVKAHPVIASFKTSQLINAPTTTIIGANTMDLRISHRFSNAGTASDGGPHTLYGFDNSSNIRISFNYAFNKRFMIGFARSKRFELLDGSAKYMILQQKKGGKGAMPISMSIYGDMGYTTETMSRLYNGADSSTKHNEADRFTYNSQLLIARKFSDRLTLEIIGSYTHRNYVVASINSYNNAVDENNLISGGVGGRLMLTKRCGIVADYYYTLSNYRYKNPTDPHYMPLSVGIEIETGGHVFHIFFTNAAGIDPNDYIPNTTDSWLKGGYKFGFDFSRSFIFTKKNKKPKNDGDAWKH